MESGIEESGDRHRGEVVGELVHAHRGGLRGRADGVQSSPSPTVPCAQATTGHPPSGAGVFGVNTTAVPTAGRLR